VTDSATFTTSENEDEDLGEDLGDLLLEVLPPDGSAMSNQSAREALNGTEADRDKRPLHAGVILLCPAPHKR